MPPAVLEQGHQSANAPFCSNDIGAYSALAGYNPWVAIPLNSLADRGLGHFAFASYHASFSADVFTRSQWFDPQTTLRSFLPLDIIENAPPGTPIVPNPLEYVSGGIL